MNMNDICPCPKLTCPNHGKCDKCTSRHARLGFMNYCGFHTWLSTIQAAIDESPDSATAEKLNGLLAAQLEAYDTLMEEHGLEKENQSRLFEQVKAYSDH